jgi:hypothetical protein
LTCELIGFSTVTSLYISIDTQMCVWEKREGNDILVYIYLPIDFLYIVFYKRNFVFIILPTFFYVATMFQCGESQGIYDTYTRPEYLSSILRADYICEFDLFKTAGKISIFLRHHVYGSSQKKKALTCVCRR